MEDHSPSSPPSPKRLTTEQALSGSAAGESESTHISSPRMLPPPPPPTMANPISGSESPFGSNYLLPPENSSMVQELGHQENPTVHQDLPPSNEGIQPQAASNPLHPRPNNVPEREFHSWHRQPLSHANFRRP
ncbi:hypothetical protein L6164_031701 [Bauhinia variegata]|uniref:Uncharacterized protein n=1 Tax=Bauhinia variegata TaxID=167791 RepID=A0ACB9LGA6_BAUVA|nr:hypothetical protein L6164_031701 [Bauhinia variegata]